MTGQQFIEAMTKQIAGRGMLLREYVPADLTKDAAEIGLWYRKPTGAEEDVQAAQEESDKIFRAGGAR